MRDSVPSPRYSPVCNVLRQWKTSLIPTYRVYRLYDATIIVFNSFQWLECDFLSYLDNWEKSIQEFPGLSRAQRNNMLLSPETRLGLRTTGNRVL